MNIYDPQYNKNRLQSYSSFRGIEDEFFDRSSSKSNNSVLQNGGGFPLTLPQASINPQNQMSNSLTQNSESVPENISQSFILSRSQPISKIPQNSGGFSKNMSQSSTVSGNQPMSLVDQIENNSSKDRGSEKSSAIVRRKSLDNPSQSGNYREQLEKRPLPNESVSFEANDHYGAATKKLSL